VTGINQQVSFDALEAGMRLEGLVAAGPVTLKLVERVGADAATIFYTGDDGSPGTVVALRANEAKWRQVADRQRSAFDGKAAEYRLAAEALRIKMAGQFDPMLAVTTSDLDPLPHQIQAVYGHLLNKIPLRFLLADDPGAGKTIMAGLYLKELLLRGDLNRCLIVAPGSLVDQWQNELHDKFRLRFAILTRDLIKTVPPGENPFEVYPHLIARMDQLSRSDELQRHADRTRFDVVVVDEAHRMSAKQFGTEVKRTRRYELGERLGTVTEHLLLMTATPHAGDEGDFQRFLALLDKDRFAGRHQGGALPTNVEGIMLRRIKEELKTFEGKLLFPQRFASTVTYQLGDAERELYDAVTDYVQQGMNRADALRTQGQGRRGNTVGFALTVLQRRLASSPEAIFKSLERRHKRLSDRLHAELFSSQPDEFAVDVNLQDYESAEEALDDLDNVDRESLERQVVDGATSAQTVEELEAEIDHLTQLVNMARGVRHAGTEISKWDRLRSLLETEPLMRVSLVERHKIIIFTEHRDTLDYLVREIRNLLGRPDAVSSIHGGLGRQERLAVQDEFRQNPDLTVLVATDAAGEGLNLQRAHLMINYDLPWNPNRIEQRFGRIHRIGQDQPCHLWNMVAIDTREGAVYHRLLTKLEQMQATYKGKIFDVLGELFAEAPLSKLLIDAIKYGELPETRERLDKVIDERVAEGLPELIRKQALHTDILKKTDVDRIRAQMEEARARRLQPHHIDGFFRGAFTAQRGWIKPRRGEPGRFEVTRVPKAVQKFVPAGTHINGEYEAVCFERMRIQGKPHADLLAPGHPLLDALVDSTIDRLGVELERGTVLVDRLDAGEQPRLLVAVRHEVLDGHVPPRPVFKRFQYIELTEDGNRIEGVADAPYLDYAAPNAAELELVRDLLSQEWLSQGPELAVIWATGTDLPMQLERIQDRVSTDVGRTRRLVKERLNLEINRKHRELAEAEEKLRDGKSVKVKPESIKLQIDAYETQLAARLAELDRDEHLAALPAQVSSVALVVPQGLLHRLGGLRDQPAEYYTKDTMRIAARAMRAVMEAERRLGRSPEPQPHNNPGFDILSSGPDGHCVFIEVKGSETKKRFAVTRNEVIVGKNADHFRLALVDLAVRGPDHDEVRYLPRPFNGIDIAEDFALYSVTLDWPRFWADGCEPM